MLRRLVVPSVAAVLIGPFSPIGSASAAVLFTCPQIAATSYAALQPGLRHTQTAQGSVIFLENQSGVPCDNGEVFSSTAGDTSGGQGAITTYGTRPLGCPTAWGGAGPDYTDQTPILLGASENTFIIGWMSPLGGSNGSIKVKQGPAGDRWRIVYNITAGKYHPQPGQKTKIKGPLTLAPDPGFTYTCADDSDPLERVTLSSAGPLVVSQK